MMRARLLFCVLLILCMAASSPVMPQRRRRPSLPDYYRAFRVKESHGRVARIVLQNGLTVLIEEQPMRPLAALVTYVKAGYWRADEKEAVAAKLLELSFSGLTDLPERTRREAGGFFESRTAADFTAFTTLVPSENVDEALEIHADLLHSPRLQEAAGGIDGVVQRSRPGTTSPGRAAQAGLWRLAYPGWGGRVAELEFEGLAADRAALTPEVRRAFHSAQYQPARVIVAISGAVLQEPILRKVVELYGNLGVAGERSNPAAAATAPDPGKFVFQYLHRRDDSQNPRILFGFRVPDVSHPDYYPLALLGAILGRGRASLLQRTLVASGAALEVETDLTPLPGGGLLAISLVADGERIDAAEVGVLAAVAALRQELVSRSELDRARAWLLREHYESLESLERRAMQLARQEALLAVGELQKVPERLQSVTAQQVRRVAARYLVESNLSLLESFPEWMEARNFTPETLLETLQLLLPAETSKIIKELQALRAARSHLAFTPPRFEPRFLKYELKRTSILRGPEIFLEEDHVVPLVHFGLFFPGGRIEESPANIGITELMLRSILRNVEGEQGWPAWLDLELRGLRVTPVNEPDFFGLQATVFSSHFAEVLLEMAGWLRRPLSDEKPFALEKQRAMAASRGQQEDPIHTAELAVRKSLFGPHPYAFEKLGTASVLEKIDLSQVTSWAHRQTDGVHPLIVVRGDVAGTSFLPALISSLSNSKWENKQRITKALDEETIRDFAASYGPGFLLAGFQGPVRGAREDWLLNVLEGLVYLRGGSIPSPEAEGPALTGTRVFHHTYQSGGFVYFLVPVPEAEQQGTEQVLRGLLLRLKEARILEQDFLDALVLTISRFYSDQQEGRRYLLRLATDLISGEKPSYQKEYLTMLKGTQIEDLREMARRLFRPPQGSLPERDSAEPAGGRP